MSHPTTASAEPTVSPETDTTVAHEPAATATVSVEVGDALLLEDMLVEEVSIDGMCGVY